MDAAVSPSKCAMTIAILSLLLSPAHIPNRFFIWITLDFSFTGHSSGQTTPPACTLLSVGQNLTLLPVIQAFSGTQNVSSVQKDEAWRVNVRIQGVDLDHGYLCGTMEALNVPMADTPVVTFWEGEIVDTKNHTFFTGKWEASPEDDIRHWTKFSSFSPLSSQVEVDGGKSLDLSNYPYIFMSRLAHPSEFVL
ncbi:hypothetical protein V2J09_006675 [Rumex salicifolius]